MVRRNANIVQLIITALLCLLFKIHDWQFIWMPISIFLGLKAFGIVIIWFMGLFVSKTKEYTEFSKFYHFTFMCVQKALLEYGGYIPHVTGLEKLPKDHRYLIVFNHCSKFDPMLINTVISDEPIIHISKPENFKIPIGGAYMRRDCNLSFKRNDLKENAKVILKAANFIKEDKFSIGLAPEGTRNKGDTSKMLPFHEGIFKIPLRSERDIVVIEIRNTEKICKNFPFKKTDVELNVLDVIKYNDYKDMSTFEISSKVEKILQDKIDSRK